MNPVSKRIAALREFMEAEETDAIFISCTDPHLGEYMTDRWQVRKFITGFSGSYGSVVVTMDHAGLWTDTRYFLQAEHQLQGSGIAMHKLRVPDSVLPEEWLIANLKPGQRIGIDITTLPVHSFREFDSKFRKAGLKLVPVPDPFETIWDDRPPLPDTPVFELDVKYTGLSRKEKLDAIQTELGKRGADLQVISMPDELAWTFNLRGHDIPFTPVFSGYGLVGKVGKILFADTGKFSETLKNQLETEGIELHPYSRFLYHLGTLRNLKVLLDPSATNCSIFRAVEKNCVVVEGPSIIGILKSRKNPVEIQGIRNAMKKDGVALVKFLFHLHNCLGSETMTEYTAGRKLAGFRSENEGFSGESFPPLIGYKDHGALVHFTVNEENAYKIEAEGMLLFDSGGHYPEGTTDVTRTVVLGAVTDQQRTDFTLALKGMIALSMAKFPFGTKGCHLDILARRALWDQGLNYGHGTGHGVGHFLNVHEGPMSIRQEYNPVNIEPGMVLSNEPGLYRTNQYGVRTENMMVCVEDEENEFGKFMRFETLTLCPVDLRAIKPDLLTEAEIQWIDNYHAKVREELLNLLPEEMKGFFLSITRNMNHQQGTVK